MWIRIRPYNKQRVGNKPMWCGGLGHEALANPASVTRPQNMTAADYPGPPTYCYAARCTTVAVCKFSVAL